METHYNDIVTKNGEEATRFVVVTRKGNCDGLYLKKQDRIMVHLVSAKHGLKGLMNVLVKKFKTRKITFTPLITDGIMNKVRGVIKTVPANAKGNPYGEDIHILETIWQ